MGWSLRYINRWNDGDNVKVAKSCNGAISCTNEECTLRKNVHLVPMSTKLKTDEWCEKSSCQACHAPLTHIQCSYVAIFTFSGDTCRLTPGHKEGQNVHTHDSFVPKKISPQQADKLHGMVKNGATPSELQMGMSKRTNNLGNASEIHPDFENIEKLRYERRKILKASPIEQPKMNSSIEDFFKIQEEFPGYITVPWLAKGEMVITFCPPKLKKVFEIHKYPFITDVTFSVFESGYYLCTSVMYCEVLQSHPIAFGAVLDGITAKHFDFYYQALFNAYEIVFPQDPDEENGKNILGFLQDFSQAQHKGFISAYKRQTKNSKKEGLKYLKGCTVHYERNARKLAETYANDMHDGSRKQMKKMRKLLFGLRMVETEAQYNKIWEKVLEMYPKSKRFVRWWNSESVRGSIFPAVSTMNSRLLRHYCFTTNAVESFHNKLYHLIKKNQPLNNNLRSVLQYTEHGEKALSHFIKGARLYYGNNNEESRKRKASNARTRRNRRKSAKYVNDGRAPDYIQALVKVFKNHEWDPLESSSDNSSEDDINNVQGNISDEITDDELELHDIHVSTNEVWSLDDYPDGFDSTSSDDDDHEQKMSDKENTSRSSISSEDSSNSENENEDENNVSSEEEEEEEEEEKENKKKEARSKNYDHYLLRLCPWDSNSCYIDAPMELLLQSILPEMLPDNDNITFESTNRFDEELLQAYLAYKNNNYDDRVRGLRLLREFVWSSTRFDRSFHDAAEFFQFYVENMSDRLQAAFGARVRCRTTCTSNAFHIQEHHERNNTQIMIHVKPADLNRRFQGYDEQEKTKELSKCILDKLKSIKLKKCSACNSLATRENEIISWPKYMFIRDESAPTGAKEMLTFPTSLELSDDKTYYIQGRVNSLARTGHHFTSVGIIPNNGSLFLAEIDNLSGAMNIIKSEDRLQAEMMLVQNNLYPVFLCYRLGLK